MDITDTRSSSRAATAVAELYAGHALGLIRLAVLLVGDRASAEDVVQDAFLGLYRRWDRLPDTSAPLAYLRVCVLNGSRTALRRRARSRLQAPALAEPPPRPRPARCCPRSSRRSPARWPGSRTGSARRWCSATTSTCRRKRSPRPWASAAAPSSPATSRALAAVGRMLKEGS